VLVGRATNAVQQLADGYRADRAILLADRTLE